MKVTDEDYKECISFWRDAPIPLFTLLDYHLGNKSGDVLRVKVIEVMWDVNFHQWEITCKVLNRDYSKRWT